MQAPLGMRGRMRRSGTFCGRALPEGESIESGRANVLRSRRWALADHDKPMERRNFFNADHVYEANDSSIDAHGHVGWSGLHVHD